LYPNTQKNPLGTERRLFSNTLIVFTSDNGGLYGITKQKPLRAGKGSYYEGGIREPFFFVYNKKIESGSKSDVPITNMDIFPTVLAYAGIENTTIAFDGAELSDVLEQKTQTLERPLFWHFPIYLQAYNVNVVRKGDWKLHYYFEDDGLELYNLSEDIGEINNLAEKYPEKTDELFGLLKEWWERTNAPIPTTLNPEFIDNIQ